MDTNLIKFIEINKSKIAKIYNYRCSSSKYIVYIFLKEAGSTNWELLWNAMEHCDVNTLMINDEIENTFNGEVGEYIEI
ncbi:MAG: hypothetical protein FWG68_02825 [Defluviitaleaceae bacterium]|nr:hypothetical protein [Defluviitaleaceae bacterium]